MPNFTDGTAPLGSNDAIGSYRTGEIPKITGSANPVTSRSNGFGTASGAFTFTKNGQDNYTGGNWNIQWGELKFDAYRSSSAYNRTDNKVVPAGYVVRYIIKY